MAASSSEFYRHGELGPPRGRSTVMSLVPLAIEYLTLPADLHAAPAVHQMEVATPQRHAHTAVSTVTTRCQNFA